MAVLDWIVLGLLALSMLVGALRGLVYEVLSLGVWIAAFIAAQWFAPAVAPHMPFGDSEVLRYGLAFVAVFALAVFAGSLLTWLVSKLFAAAGLRPADRALGAVFGLARGVVVVLAVAVLVNMSPLKTEPWWTSAHSAAWATEALVHLRPMLPQQWIRYLP